MLKRKEEQKTEEELAMRDGNSSVTSVRDLTSEQKNFILRQLANPKIKSDVVGIVRKVKEKFGIKIGWGTMRRFVTSLQRKSRRRGVVRRNSSCV